MPDKVWGLSSSPVDALSPGAALVTGCERDDAGDVRLYLHARYLNEFVTIPAGDDADGAERAWAATSSCLLWLIEREPVIDHEGTT
jgi:hypothetical protein